MSDKHLFQPWQKSSATTEHNRLQTILKRLAEEMNCTQALPMFEAGVAPNVARETPADAMPFGFFVGDARDSDDLPAIPEVWRPIQATLERFFEKFELEPYDFGAFAILTNTRAAAMEWADKLDDALVKKELKAPGDPGFQVRDVDDSTFIVCCEFSHPDSAAASTDDDAGDDDDTDE